LKANSTYSWFLLYGYITMHNQQNIKYVCAVWQGCTNPGCQVARETKFWMVRLLCETCLILFFWHVQFGGGF